MIAQRTIISGSTGPIFAIFSPNESFLGADDRPGPLSAISQGTLPWQPILWKNGKLPSSFVALAFRNGMGYRYPNVRINSVNDASISCKNFVKLQSSQSPFVNFWYDTAKTVVFSRISPDVLDRFLQSFHPMKALWMQMIDLDFIFRFSSDVAMAAK